MNRAGDAMRSGSFEQVRSLLTQTASAPGQPDYRGWEWHYLNNILNARSERLPLPAAVSGERASRGMGGPPTLSEDGRYAVWVRNAREENPEDEEPDSRRRTLTVVDLSAPDKVAWVKTKTDERLGSSGGWGSPGVYAAADRVECQRPP